MVITSTIEAFLPAFLAAGALIGISVSAWLIRFPRAAFLLLVMSLITGQVIRYSLPGQGGGLLLSDIAVVLVIGATLWQRGSRLQDKTKAGELSKHIAVLTLLITLFALWSLIGLIVNASHLEIKEMLIALSYWTRLTVYLLLLPALIWLFAEKNAVYTFAVKALTATVLIISILGFVQLWILPDLQVLTSIGWDPHQQRLVSTWLDPNLLAGFLLMTLPFMVWSAVSKKKHIIFSILLLVLPVLALLATQSRSGLVALFGTALIITPLWLIRWLRTHSKAKVVFLGALFSMSLLLFFLGAVMLGDRALGLLRNDETVQIRSQALTKVWTMAQDASLFGTGYNAYQFAALEAGLIGDFTIHSRGGADNSWLTLWVTTGITGIVLFLLPWLFVLHSFIRNWLRHGDYVALLAVTAFVSLFIHAQFVNSFLYGHLLITLGVLCAVAYRRNLVP